MYIVFLFKTNIGKLFFNHYWAINGNFKFDTQKQLKDEEGNSINI